MENDDISRAVREEHAVSKDDAHALNVGVIPDGVFLVDTFTVPAGARAEFEATMRRNREFIRTLDGFRGDAVLVRTQGEATFDVATIAAWESPGAIARAREQVTAYYQQIGFDMPAFIARWGIRLQRTFCSAPRELQ